MRKNNLPAFLFVILGSLLFSSCELVGDIFEAGVWTGFLIIVVIVALVIWLITRFRRK